MITLPKNIAEVVKLTARKNELYTALFTQLYTFFCAVFL